MRTLHAWWAVIGVVLGVAAGGTPPGGAPPRPPSCLTQPPTVTLPPGKQPRPYDRDHLAAGTAVAATGAQLLLPTTSHIVIHVAGGAGICWSGGEALGAFPPAASWNTIHETYGMVAGYTNRFAAPPPAPPRPAPARPPRASRTAKASASMPAATATGPSATCTWCTGGTTASRTTGTTRGWSNHPFSSS